MFSVVEPGTIVLSSQGGNLQYGNRAWLSWQEDHQCNVS
jgi:hypothetical protein